MYLSTDQLTSLAPPRILPQKKVQSLLEKGSGKLNEDVLLQAGNLYGVFDGATSLDSQQAQNRLTGGLIAAQTAALSFSTDNSSLYQGAKKANTCIRQAQSSHNIPTAKRHTLWSTSLAVIRIEGHSRFEYCQTGDALILLLLKNGSYKIVTPDIDIDQETLQLWKETPLSGQASIHEVMADQIRKVRLQMNVSYGVLNGEPEALHFLQHGFEDLTNVSDILLFTDGLFLPRENPNEENDWQTFVDLYRLGGLQHIRNHVRKLQQQDTSCRKYPRFKIHDDIAALSITLP